MSKARKPGKILDVWALDTSIAIITANNIAVQQIEIATRDVGR